LCGSEDSPNKCGGGENGYHLYDDARALFSQTIKAGAEVTVTKQSGDDAQYYVLDLVDFELVADPIGQPSDLESITSHGAVEGNYLKLF
jgi:hypothetical protein